MPFNIGPGELILVLVIVLIIFGPGKLPDIGKAFASRTGKLVDQFSGYTTSDGGKVNGKLTLGENIADFGGLTVAYAAMEKALGNGPRTKIDGFTPEQRFFIAWAQNWAANMRPEFARLLLNIDPHPLPRFRAIGPPSNMPAFAKAFACQPGDAMVRPPHLRCRIW